MVSPILLESYEESNPVHYRNGYEFQLFDEAPYEAHLELSAAISGKSCNDTGNVEKNGIIVALNIELMYNGPQQVIFGATMPQGPSTQQLLPPEFVIKPQFADCPYEAFLVEGMVYDKLAPLQGQLVPKYFGIWSFQHAGSTDESHLIEKVHGKSLAKYAPEERLRFQKKIWQSYVTLSSYGVVHGEVAWRHIFITEDDKVRLIDFDQAEICKTVQEAQKQNKIDVETLFNDSVRWAKPT